MSWASASAVSRRCAGLLGLAGGDQQPREDGVVEGDIERSAPSVRKVSRSVVRVAM